MSKTFKTTFYMAHTVYDCIDGVKILKIFKQRPNEALGTLTTNGKIYTTPGGI